MPPRRISRTITFSLPPDMFEQVQRVKEEEGRDMSVKGGVMLGHWGGVKLYHPVGSCPPKKSELTGQHKCPRQWLRGMPCLRRGSRRQAGRS